MIWIILIFAIVALAVVWFVYPAARKFIAGVATALALGAAAVLTGLADFLQGIQ